MCSENFDIGEYYGHYKTIDELKEALKNKKIGIAMFKINLIRLYSYYEDVEVLLEGLQFIVSQENSMPAEFLTYITPKQKEKIKKLLEKEEDIPLKEFLFALHSLGFQMKIKKIEFDYLEYD